MENFHKNQPKSLEYHKFFKNIKLLFTDINIYTMNNKTDHISEKNIFKNNKKEKKSVIFSILGRIRIHIKMKRFSNTGYTVTMEYARFFLTLLLETLFEHKEHLK